MNTMGQAAEQLGLKSGMLQSDKTVFSTPETYAAALNETNDQIRQWNKTVQGMNALDNPALTTGRLVDAGAAYGVGKGSQVVDEATNDEPKEEKDGAWLLLLLPFALLIVVILYITKGK